MKKKWVQTLCVMMMLGASLFLQGCGQEADEMNTLKTVVESSDSYAETDNRIEKSEAEEAGGEESNGDTGEGAEQDVKQEDGTVEATETGKESEGIVETGTDTEQGDAGKESSTETKETPKPESGKEPVTGTKPAPKPESDKKPVASVKPAPQPVIAETDLATPATAGALRVDGTQLVDCNGNPVQLKGVSTHGIAWFPGYINEECFKQFREEWNVNVIRLAMYTAENGGYCTDGNKDDLKTLVKNGVEYATNNDMYVIIDWHVLNDKNPNTYIEESKKFFEEMSGEYADYNNVIYEICNEPNGGTSWSDIKSYAEQVIAVIRANDADGIILVGTPNWSQYVDQAAADPITGYDNIMYTLHFYAATHTDWLRDNMKAAIDAGLPVFVSEYGICDASGNGAIDETQANKWVEVMNAYGVSYVTWNISNKNETSAIFSSGCNKVSGFVESDLSASGKWLYKMLTGEATVGLSGGSSTGGTSSGNGDSSNGTSAGGGTNGTGNGGASDNNGSTGDSALGGTEITMTNGDLSYTAVIKNSWESEGKVFYQYDLTLTNNSGSDCTAWEIDLQFGGDIAFSDGWNGNFTANGSTLHIVCKDYNGSIASGGSVKDIGFILSGAKDLTIIE